MIKEFTQNLHFGKPFKSMILDINYAKGSEAQGLGPDDIHEGKVRKRKPFPTSFSGCVGYPWGETPSISIHNSYVQPFPNFLNFTQLLSEDRWTYPKYRLVNLLYAELGTVNCLNEGYGNSVRDIPILYVRNTIDLVHHGTKAERWWRFLLNYLC